MVRSRRQRGKKGWAVVLTALVAVAMASTLSGTARANPTVFSAGPGAATVTGTAPTTMSFPLGRTGDLGFDTWLRYRTENGTAIAGSDYTGASATWALSR